MNSKLMKIGVAGGMVGVLLVVVFLAWAANKPIVDGVGDGASVAPKDLWEIYQKMPAKEDVDQILRDFDFKWVDGEKEKWGDSLNFDQKSTDPSKMVILSKLNILRQQAFSEPLPFANGLSGYDWLKKNTRSIQLTLDCDNNRAGQGVLYLNRGVSVWDPRSSANCTEPFPNFQLMPYIAPLYLIVHEARHNEVGDPGHTCHQGQSDAVFENGSGYSYATMYLMWVYKYGIYDSLEIKEEAKNVAMMLLGSRFCSTPKHSNPKVQAIIDEFAKLNK